MKISEIIKSSKTAYPSLEIVPPLNGITKDELIEQVKPFMEFDPKYINVTCHRDEFEFREQPDGTFKKFLVRNRISEVTVCAAIKSAFGILTVPHIICGGSSKEAIESELYNLQFLGIHNVFALRGDPAAGEKRFTPADNGYAHANELVEGIREFDRERGADFCIGVAAYPEKHAEAPNLGVDILNLKKKVDAGADYIITQMFFDNKVFYDFEAKCRQAGITVPIIPGLKPISTKKHIELLPQSFSLDIPSELTDQVNAAGDDKNAIYEIGAEWCKAQCKDLIAHGVPAVHFYTMGKAKNIVGILKDCF